MSLPELYARLAGPRAQPADLALALTRLGDHHRDRGELDAARAAYDAALSLGFPGTALLGRGVVALVTGEPGALALFRAAREALLAEGDVGGAASAEANGGTVALRDGNARDAARSFASAIALRAGAGLPRDPLLHANLAGCHARCGAGDAALAEALLARDAAVGPTTALVAALLGDLHDDADRTAEAVAAYEEAAAGLLDPAERARVLVALAGLRYQQGDGLAAAEAFEAALPALRAGSPPQRLCEALVNLGGIHYENQAPALAEARLNEALGVLPPDRLLEARLRHNRGLARISLGRLDEARADLERSAALYGVEGAHAGQARSLGSLVDLHRYRGDLEAAQEVQRAQITLREAHGVGYRETGMAYTPVEDRSLNISGAALRRARAGDWRGPVLIIAPPAHGAGGPLFPRGAVSVASFLQAHGVPCAVLPLAHDLDPYASPSETAARIQAALQGALASLRPRAVGISVTFSYLYPQGQAIARAVRALDPEVPILIGGPHVTYQDEACLRETPEIDVVVRGEGEWTALDLVRALDAGADLAGVPGITWRAPDGSLHRNASRPLGSVLELAPEDFGLLPASFVHTMDITALTSRGCAWRCRFCHEFRYWGGVVREHPIDRVIDEAGRLARYGNVLQGIDDSMLDMRTPYFLELVRRLGQTEGLSANFGLLSRLDTLTAEGARAMRDAGLRWVCVGVESGSQRVLDAMNKSLKVEQIRDGLQLARDGGLMASGFLIVGHPGDDAGETAVTREFVDGLFRDDLIDFLDLSTFSPYPGTPFHSNPERFGIEILVRDWNLWRRTNRPVAQLKDYPADEIYLGMLALLAVQHRHLAQRGRATPPALGTGA